MKRKGLIAVAALAMVLGVGVVVGTHQDAKEVEAVDSGTVIYLDDPSESWFAANAKVAFWNHQASVFEEFKYDSDSGKYKVTLANACTSFNLFRGSALEWGSKYNQSANGSFVEGKNMIINPSYNGGDMVYDWGTYVPPSSKKDPLAETHSFYVYDKYNCLGEFSQIKVYGFDPTEEYEDMVWPGVHPAISEVKVGNFNMYQVTISVSYNSFILNNGSIQTIDIDATGYEDNVLLLYDEDNVKWNPTSYYTDVPSEEGYYILGTRNNWSFNDTVPAPKLSDGDEENVAKLLNFEVTKGEKFKVVRYYEEDRTYYGNPDDDGDCVIDESGNVNVFLAKSNHRVYIEKIVPPDVPTEGYGSYVCGDFTNYKFDGALKMTDATDKGYKAYSLSFHLEIGKAIKPRCYYEDRLDPADQWAIYDGAPDSSYGELDEEGNFKAKVAGDYDVYVFFQDRNGDSKEEFYFYVVNHKFTDTISVTIGETTVNMTKVDKDINKEQYEATLDVTSGDSVSFKVGGAAMTPSPVDDGTLNNNVDGSCNKILETHEQAKVFLKVDYEGNVKFWIGGRTHEFYVVTDEYLGMVVNPAEKDNRHFMKTNLELTAGDTFDIYCLTRFAPSGDNFGQDVGLGFTSDGSKVTCTKTGVYNIYLDDSEGDNAKLWISGQTAADVKATAFANFFMGKFENGHGHTGVCVADGSTNPTVISSTWSECITEYNTKIKGDEDAEGILRNALSTGDELYNLFADLYDTIYVKYGKSLVNFAGRNVTPTDGALNGFATAENVPTITVVAIALAVSAYLSFTTLIIIKRKRAHK